MSAAVNLAATVPASIPIAGFKQVCDVATVDNALQQLTSSASDALKSTRQKMLRLGGSRLTVKPAGVPGKDALYQDLPNFTEVLDDIRKHIALVSDNRDAIELPPMLLLGKPGIGKTRFGNAKLAGRDEVEQADIAESRGKQKQRIGF